ncbi:hypothetical protein BJ964_006697 [Actinoplanes lobatus]|uniref:Uncharacterized protein n=1 Tax=Actinoplanes lobatus TaxID=113568 RepID=A0A7W7MJN4_9ACTN|nr:hypothetical protein [Actinoplanes lobatus]
MSQIDGIADQLSMHVRRHGMPDDLPVELVDCGRQVQSALSGVQGGDVPDQLAACCDRGEIVADQVQRRRGLFILPGQ